MTAPSSETGATPGAAPRLSVITPTGGRLRALLRKARALAAQTAPPAAFEWRLWSNDPADATEVLRARLRALALPFAWRLDGGEALAAGAARNRAAEGARGTVLLLSDDDCLPDPGAVAAQLRAHDADPGVAWIGPLRLPAELRREARAEPFERPLRLPGGRASWINLTGANSAVPAAAYRAVGGYDPEWRGYGGEDPELAWRLRRRGVRFRHVADAGAVHLGRVWDDADKAYRAGWAHRRVWERHRALEVGLALGVHPALLCAKRSVFGGPWARWLDGEVAAYERAYARGAGDAARRPGAAAPDAPPAPDAPIGPHGAGVGYDPKGRSGRAEGTSEGGDA